MTESFPSRLQPGIKRRPDGNAASVRPSSRINTPRPEVGAPLDFAIGKR